MLYELQIFKRRSFAFSLVAIALCIVASGLVFGQRPTPTPKKSKAPDPVATPPIKEVIRADASTKNNAKDGIRIPLTNSSKVNIIRNWSVANEPMAQLLRVHTPDGRTLINGNGTLEFKCNKNSKFTVSKKVTLKQGKSEEFSLADLCFRFDFLTPSSGRKTLKYGAKKNGYIFEEGGFKANKIELSKEYFENLVRVLYRCLGTSDDLYFSNVKDVNGTISVNSSTMAFKSPVQQFSVEFDGLTVGQPEISGPITAKPFGTVCLPAFNAESAAFIADSFSNTP